MRIELERAIQAEIQSLTEASSSIPFAMIDRILLAIRHLPPAAIRPSAFFSSYPETRWTRGGIPCKMAARTSRRPRGTFLNPLTGSLLNQKCLLRAQKRSEATYPVPPAASATRDMMYLSTYSTSTSSAGGSPPHSSRSPGRDPGFVAGDCVRVNIEWL